MKKIGIIIFIIALIIGVGLANVFSFGKASAGFFSFSFKRGVSGSGNIASEKRAVSSFKSVKVSGAIQVEIVAQKDFSVEVQADDNLLSLIETEVDGDFLRVKSNRRYNTKNPIIVKISAPNVEMLDVSGASKINLTDLNNEFLTVDVSGASKINVSGVTKELIVDVSGASEIDTANLRAVNASVEASGASRVDLTVAGDLKAKASGASRIIYEGTPRNVENKTSGASSVKQK